MSRCTLFAMAALLFLPVAPALAEDQTEPFSHHDGSAEGKKSIGGSGPMIRFELGEAKTIKGLKLHASRYGTPKAPKEKIQIHFVSEDESEVIATRLVPYSRFERGDETWVIVIFDQPVKALSTFWVSCDFRAQQTKGVYVSYDTSTGGKWSRIGIPALESKPTSFDGDWMIEVIPATE